MMWIRQDRTRHVHVLVLGIVICAAIQATQSQTHTEEAKIRKAVERFYSYFSQHQYDRMWAMLSKAVKEGNDNNKSRYVKEVNQARSLRVSIQIRSVQIEGSRATVTFVMRMRSDATDDSPSKTHEETYEDVWVKEKGKWLFDNSRVLSEPASRLTKAETTNPRRRTGKPLTAQI